MLRTYVRTDIYRAYNHVDNPAGLSNNDDLVFVQQFYRILSPFPVMVTSYIDIKVLFAVHTNNTMMGENSYIPELLLLGLELASRRPHDVRPPLDIACIGFPLRIR